MKLKTPISTMFSTGTRFQVGKWLVSKVLLLFILTYSLSVSVYSQDHVYWRDLQTNGDWDWGSSCDNTGNDGHWNWTVAGGFRKRPDCYLTANIIHFDNNNQVVMNLNSIDNYFVNQIQFDAGTGDRTINTDNLICLNFKQNNGDAKIENNVVFTTHTFNVNINIEAGTWMQFNPVNGYLDFNNPITNHSGNTIHIFGNQQVTFNGDITSTSGAPGVTVNGLSGNVTAVYAGVSKTYSGPTTITSGTTLRISSDQTLGDISLNSGGTLIVDPGMTLTITGTWTGGGTLTNNGTIVLEGPSAFPGAGTTVTAMNRLTINKPGGVTLDNALEVSDVLTMTSGIVTTTATNILSITNTATAAITGYSSTSYIRGPLQRTLPDNISTDGTTYIFPVGDEAANYRPFELVNIRTGGTSPVIIVTAASSGAVTVDATITSIAARNWHAEVVSGNFTNTTVRITESGLASTNVVGSSGAQSGDYTYQGSNSVGASITSNAGIVLPNYFAIGNNALVTLQPDLTGLCQGDLVYVPIYVTGNDVNALDLYLDFDHNVLLESPPGFANEYPGFSFDPLSNYNFVPNATAYVGILYFDENGGYNFSGEKIVDLLFIYNGGTTNIHLRQSPEIPPPPLCQMYDHFGAPITPITFTDTQVSGSFTVGIPTFTAGATSLCVDPPDETYTATAANATGIAYSVLPVAAGTIDPVTGVMNWNAAFTGTATITATAEGCGGPKSADRLVEVNPNPTTSPIYHD